MRSLTAREVLETKLSASVAMPQPADESDDPTFTWSLKLIAIFRRSIFTRHRGHIASQDNFHLRHGAWSEEPMFFTICAAVLDFGPYAIFAAGFYHGADELNHALGGFHFAARHLDGHHQLGAC